MKTFAPSNFELVLKTLRNFGLLLETDAKLPSVSGLIAGETVRGSWWAHPRSQDIFVVLQQLADHKDVMTTKLLSGKVTFVHRKLWSAILSIGAARERWQIHALPSSAQVLLKIMDRQGELRSDQVKWPPKFKSVKSGPAVRELEKRLLIHTEEFHTESGAHAKRLETWECWARRSRFNKKAPEVSEANQILEERLSVLNELFGAAAELPWTRSK